MARSVVVSRIALALLAAAVLVFLWMLIRPPGAWADGRTLLAALLFGAAIGLVGRDV